MFLRHWKFHLVDFKFAPHVLDETFLILWSLQKRNQRKIKKTELLILIKVKISKYSVLRFFTHWIVHIYCFKNWMQFMWFKLKGRRAFWRHTVSWLINTELRRSLFDSHTKREGSSIVACWVHLSKYKIILKDIS